MDGEFQAGRTLEFNFKSDAHRHVSLRQSRIALEFEVAYGEVNETASDIVAGAQDTYARPARSIEEGGRIQGRGHACREAGSQEPVCAAGQG